MEISKELLLSSEKVTEIIEHNKDKLFPTREAVWEAIKAQRAKILLIYEADKIKAVEEAKREGKERVCDYLIGLLTNQNKQAPFAISMIKILEVLKEGEK